MILIKPVVGDIHCHLKNALKFLCLLFFVAPLQVVLGESEREVGRRLLIDPIEQIGDLIIPLRSDILGRVVETKILSHPLVVVTELVVRLICLVLFTEELSSYLLRNLKGFYEGPCLFL